MPVLAVIGGLGTFTVWCVVVWTHPMGRLIGFIWMGLGLVMYVVYRKRKGYSLTRTVEKVVVPATMQEDIDYDQILVPIIGSRISDEMMVLACQLATEKKSSIDALYVIEVPMILPLDAALEEERLRADRALKAAAVIASQFKVKLTPGRRDRAQHGQDDRRGGRATALRGDHPGDGAQAAHRRPRSSARTVDYVLQHAPCEVLVNLVPRDYPTGGSGDDAPREAGGESACRWRAAGEDRPPPAAGRSD